MTSTELMELQRQANARNGRADSALHARLILLLNEGLTWAEIRAKLDCRQLHLGASIGAALVLHTWGSALTHHPHVHGIVPGGGLTSDGERWVACRLGFFLSVRVLSRLFRRRFLEELQAVQRRGPLQFFGEQTALADAQVFAKWLTPLRQCELVVYAKRPFAGPEAVLAYLARYTHRVAIANSRLGAIDEHGVTFGWTDYRAKGRTRHKTMTLGADEALRLKEEGASLTESEVKALTLADHGA